MVFPIAGCWFSWQSQTLVVVGEAVVLWAVSHAGFRGYEALVFMAVSDSGSVGEIGGSHGSLRCLF